MLIPSNFNVIIDSGQKLILLNNSFIISHSPWIVDGKKKLVFVEHTNDKVWFSPNKKSAGDELTFTIVYSGIPKTGLIIGKNKFGDLRHESIYICRFAHALRNVKNVHLFIT